jgi:O-methyltransferase involved in polyketide biosynthesis
VLDEKAFEETVQKFPPGPLTIVNEGLLVYLDQKEKEQLCKNIRKTLEKRGGCWITADIYIKRKDGDPLLTKNESYRKWSEKHNLEEKKFASFDDAKSFFEQVGFKIDKEAKPDYSRLTSLSNLRRIAGTTAGSSSQPDRTRLHATWQLSLRPKY